MRILSYHPFSIFANGGGNRILRRLYQGHEHNVSAIVAEGIWTSIPQGNIPETLITAWPVNRSWMRWKLRNLARWTRNHFTKPLTIAKVRSAARKVDYDVIHVVNHGAFCAALCTQEFCDNKQLWVSFHDHFDTAFSTFEDTKLLWQRADRRLAISEEIAAEYIRLFGPGEYELITDGVTEAEIKEPKAIQGKKLTVYFAGLLHLHYMPLFKVMADALDVLCNQGYQFELVLRAVQHLPFLADRKFSVVYKEMTLDSAELKAELDASDILYLPIKFNSPEFYKFSLSTKMVGYLGAPGVILYHGPRDAAACNLLQKNEAAICSSSLNAQELASQLIDALGNSAQLSANAKELARQQFNMDSLRNRFWQQSN